MFWMGFLVGSLVGSLFGACFLAIMRVATNADHQTEEMYRQYQAQQRGLYGKDHLD